MAWVVVAILAVGWVYWVVAWWMMGSFFTTETRRHGEEKKSVAPCLRASVVSSVSVLKPVKGMDAGAAENFASFCRQEGAGAYEVLFGVADANDPAVEAVRRVREAFPSVPIRLIVATGGAANPKAAILDKLAREARGEVLVISDSDIRVERDYLARVTAPLDDPGVGVVTCLYRGEGASGAAAHLEALHMDACFAPSAIVGYAMGQRMGLGATMAVRKTDLERIGGFAAFGDYLADDHQLASRIADLGLRIHLSDYVVASVLGAVTFAEQWRREVRWARAIRVSCPAKYPGLLVTFATPMALGLACVPALWPGAGVGLAPTLMLRWLVAWRFMAMLGQRSGFGRLALLPARDVLSAAVWVAGLFGRRIVWRGRRFELTGDGRLCAVGARESVFARCVRWLDARLRRAQGIYEFTDASGCVLRISVGRTERDVELSDGMRIARGERFVDIHIWNERFPKIPPQGPTLAWAMETARLTRRSMELLAGHLQQTAELADLAAVHARVTFATREMTRRVQRMMGQLGFELIEPPRPGFLRQLHDLLENVFVWALVRTYNPGGLRRQKFIRKAYHFWMARGKLMGRYAGSFSPRRHEDAKRVGS